MAERCQYGECGREPEVPIRSEVLEETFEMCERHAEKQAEEFDDMVILDE